MTSNEEEAESMVVGLSIPAQSQDAAQALKAAREDGFDYVTTHLGSDPSRPRTDVIHLEACWWRTSIVGQVVVEVDEDSNSSTQQQQQQQQQALTHQLEWANHMNVPAVILPELPSNKHAAMDYARTVLSLSLHSAATAGTIWIRTRLTSDSITAFDTLHRLCDRAHNVGMMLCLQDPTAASNNTTTTTSSSGPTKPHVAHLLTLVHRAMGCNLKCLCLPTDTFLPNKLGYPALTKAHQLILTLALRRLGRTARLLVEANNNGSFNKQNKNKKKNGGDGATGCLPHLQYVQHVRGRPEVRQALSSSEARLEEPYLDKLQRPLQPLNDQLEFQTYETFERDPVKYEKYQEAIRGALSSGEKHNDSSSSMVLLEKRLILVAGAGRGPLVTAALRAAANVQCEVDVVAVEKNPSAVAYLQSQACHNPKWTGRVRVLQKDMRQLTALDVNHRTVDLIVSELLGSFGDNELSPECLDGLLSTTGLWKKGVTVSIPKSYTAYLAPLSSMLLHHEVRSQAYYPVTASEGMDSAPTGTLRAMETPYVVRTHAASQTHPEQACWEFSHPSDDTNKERVAHLDFAPDPTHGAAYGSGYGPVDQAVAELMRSIDSAPGPATIHGFVGTFTAVLYQPKNSNEPPIQISTRPTEFSQGMFSWFPLYFPLREPLYVPSGATVKASIWRRTETGAMRTSGRVWYEWCATVLSVSGDMLASTGIHNPNGRSYEVKL